MVQGASSVHSCSSPAIILQPRYRRKQKMCLFGILLCDVTQKAMRAVRMGLTFGCFVAEYAQ